MMVQYLSRGCLQNARASLCSQAAVSLKGTCWSHKHLLCLRAPVSLTGISYVYEHLLVSPALVMSRVPIGLSACLAQLLFGACPVKLLSTHLLIYSDLRSR